MAVNNNTYAIVNSVVDQAIGDSGLTVFDAQGLIALGNTVLSSSTYTERFLNTLVQRIGKTIISSRAYVNRFKNLMRDGMEWGNIVQKISFSLIQAEDDPSYSLVDGQSVDPWTVSKPPVSQAFFSTETPFMFSVSIQRVTLKTAFTSEGAMASFIGGIMTALTNSIEESLESLGRACVNNYIAEVKGTERAINLIDKYNDTHSTAIGTVSEALESPEFLRFAVGYIKTVAKKMTGMNVIYNDGAIPRHTPKESQRLLVVTDFENLLETNVAYEAFNKEYVTLDGFIEVPYLQSIEEPMSIKVKKASTGTSVTVQNVVACLFDYEALGMYDNDHEVLSTPLNPKGQYYTIYHHLKEIWFNDLSENFVYFYLEDQAS